MRALTSAVVAGLALLAVAASCASGSEAGEASNENVSAKGGGATGQAGADAGKGGSLPDAGSFPEGGPQGGSSTVGGAAGASGASGAGGVAGSIGGAAGTTAAGSGGAASGGAAGAGSGGAPFGGSGGAPFGGSAGSSGAVGGSAGSAGAVCIPQCAGKQCGPDSCNGQCGSCGSTQSCENGSCKDVCQSTWKTALTGITPSRAVVDGGTLFVVGKKGNQGYLGTFDTCTGKESASQTTLLGASSSLISVQLSATHVFAAGEGANVGLVVRAKRTTLALEASDPLVGSNDGDEVWDATPTAAGNLWMTGIAGVKAPSSSLWAIEGPIGQPACGFGPFAGSSGLGRAAVSGGGKVFLVGQRDGHGVVARFDDQNCAAKTPCSCVPEQSVSIMMGPAATEVRHAALSNGKLFIVGYGSDGTNSTEFLTRLDAATLSTEAVYQMDPSTTADAFLTLSIDAGMVYVGGLRGWLGDASFQSATGQVLAIPSTFGVGTQPLWIHEPPGSHVVFGVTAQNGAVYVASLAADGALMKCAAAGCF